ncbi:hypothetical protein AB1N83_013695 [Pleurotus pulmonarius]
MLTGSDDCLCTHCSTSSWLHLDTRKSMCAVVYRWRILDDGAKDASVARRMRSTRASANCRLPSRRDLRCVVSHGKCTIDDCLSNDGSMTLVYYQIHGIVCLSTPGRP